MMPSQVRKSWYSAGRTPNQIKLDEIKQSRVVCVDLFYVPTKVAMMMFVKEVESKGEKGEEKEEEGGATESREFGVAREKQHK